MRFAHIADCHIGGWIEDKLKELTIIAFKKAVDICINENVDFVLIAGDLFNTAIPQIEMIKQTTEGLKRLKDKDIMVYLVPGSHDFSPSGKTILSVFEKAGLIKNVYNEEENSLKLTIDEKTKAKITGMLGLRNSLELLKYDSLDLANLEKEDGFKIFLLHSGINEFMPSGFGFTSLLLDKLPKGFNYYAGGHIHYVFQKKLSENSILSYPGPLFPNSFSELEELDNGGFFIVDDKLNIERREIKLKDVVKIKINADNKTPSEVEKELIGISNVTDKIVLIRVTGILKDGYPSDINFNLDNLKDAYIVLKNTASLSAKEYEELEINESIVNIEEKIVEDNLEDIKNVNFDESLVLSLLNVLDKSRSEGETVNDFEKRITEDIKNELKLKGLFER